MTYRCSYKAIYKKIGFLQCANVFEYVFQEEEYGG